LAAKDDPPPRHAKKTGGSGKTRSEQPAGLTFRF
jgi:hypothetical protein